MKKYILAALALCIAAATSMSAYLVFASPQEGEDPVKLEDAIIIHGIQMESDTPEADVEEERTGRILYNDAFDDAIIDYERVKKKRDSRVASPGGRSDFKKLRAGDRRWHLTRYRIRKNDNLWKIAKRFGVHQHMIISINEIKNPDMLKPGRYIDVPTRNGIYYRVEKGDSISEIARRYKTSQKKIIANNGLNGTVIHPGQKLFLPGARERREPVAGMRVKKVGRSVASRTRTFSWPLRGRITSGFGTRKDPLSRRRSFHCGIDISANVGTPVRAADSGRVIFSGWKPGYGNCVIMRHGGGYITVYAHNSKNLAAADATVGRGEVIAYSGMTGAVTGAHLHFEIRKYVNPLNPMRFLR
ncbi:MAG: M23 family metallopeptidase [Spirochaetes bacterium]|nr:M23 family metallopeptidase [Spirochaetota bacterium]